MVSLELGDFSSNFTRSRRADILFSQCWMVAWPVGELLLELLLTWFEDADAANNSHHTRQTLINPQSQQGGGHVTSLGW